MEFFAIIVIGSQIGNLPLSSNVDTYILRIYKSTFTFSNGFKRSGWCTVQSDVSVSEHRAKAINWTALICA